MTDEGGTGHWENQQDLLTGDFIRVWVEDDPNTETDETLTFSCMARGFVSGGITGNGAIEEWTAKGEYSNLNVLRINYPAKVNITQRDRVTNITDSSGRAIYVEIGGEPTIYNVDGISPVLDAFGKHVENTALLSRAEIQDAS